MKNSDQLLEMLRDKFDIDSVGVKLNQDTTVLIFNNNYMYEFSNQIFRDVDDCGVGVKVMYDTLVSMILHDYAEEILRKD